MRKTTDCGSSPPTLQRMAVGNGEECRYLPRFIILAKVWVRSTPHPVTVTTRIITFLVGNPYKPSFATVTGRGVDPRYGC